MYSNDNQQSPLFLAFEMINLGAIKFFLDIDFNGIKSVCGELFGMNLDPT